MSKKVHLSKTNKVIDMRLAKSKNVVSKTYQLLEPYWINRNPRERILLIIMGGILLCLLVYFFVIEPAKRVIAQKVIVVEQQQQNVLWMEQQLPLINQLKSKYSNSSKIDERQIAVLADETLNQFKLRNVTERIQPQGNSVQLWMKKAPFDDFLRWVEEVDKNGVRLVKIDITGHEDGLGNVDVSLIIEK